MIGRIATLTGSPEALTQFQRDFVDQGRTVLKSQTGLASLQVFCNATEGKAAVITTWKDSEAANGAISAMDGMRKQLAGIGVNVSLQDYETLGA